MKQNNDKTLNDSNVGLPYKDHRLFFEKFYNRRDDLLAALSNLYFSKKSNDYIFCFGLLKYLINNTSEYLYKHEEKGKEFFDNKMKEIAEFINNDKFSEALSKMEELIELINKYLAKEEILPLSQENNNDMDKFWEEEPRKAWREAKKAFTDIMKNMNL